MNCLNCEKELLKEKNKFCSSSCAASFNNKLRKPRTEESKKKVSESLKNKLKGTQEKKICESCKNESKKKICKECVKYIQNKILFEKLKITEINLQKANKIAVEILKEMYFEKNYLRIRFLIYII